MIVDSASSDSKNPLSPTSTAGLPITGSTQTKSAGFPVNCTWSQSTLSDGEERNAIRCAATTDTVPVGFGTWKQPPQACASLGARSAASKRAQAERREVTEDEGS